MGTRTTAWLHDSAARHAAGECTLPGRAWLAAGIACSLALLPASGAQTAAGSAAPASATGEKEHVQVPPPPFSEGIFPCMACHADLTADPERRELAFHDEIILRHDEEHRWCLDCHDADNRDFLRLASGAHVPFSESYRLCGQCHGEKYRDWRAGVHGKRMGSWSGQKLYLLCVHCHNPHHPRYEPMAPMPPPVGPLQLRESPAVDLSPVLGTPYQSEAKSR